MTDTSGSPRAAGGEGPASRQPKPHIAGSESPRWLALASHELRSDLNGIVGYVDLLESEILGAVNARQEAHLARIRASSLHMLELIEQINDLSRIDSHGWDLVWERVDARAEAERAAAKIRPEIEGKDLAFRLELAPGPIPLDTDLDLLRRVLLILLSNAVRSTDLGAVILSVDQGGGSVWFRVRDTGPGIPEEAREAVFEPFSQSTSDRGGGHAKGLGLTVARRFARIMGGDVTVEDAPGRGSVFSVRVPAVRPGAQ
jgi:signal transduction histidine kinase